MKHPSSTLILLAVLAVGAATFMFIMSSDMHRDSDDATEVATEETATPTDGLGIPRIETPPAPTLGVRAEGPITPFEADITADWIEQQFPDLGFSMMTPESDWSVHALVTRDALGEEFGDHGGASIAADMNDPASQYLVVTAATTLPISARGGYWGDILNDWDETPTTCAPYLEQDFLEDPGLACETFKNTNGLTVVHLTGTWQGYGDPSLINLYIVDHPDPKVKGLILSDERLLDYNPMMFLAKRIPSGEQGARDFVRTLAESLSVYEIE